MDDFLNVRPHSTKDNLFDEYRGFLTSKEEILTALLTSQESGTSIGIKSMAFGPQVFITAVEDIFVEDGQTLIILKYYDSSGYILPSYRINLLEITSVCPFTTPFTNPYLNDLSKNKSWLF